MDKQLKLLILLSIPALVFGQSLPFGAPIVDMSAARQLVIPVYANVGALPSTGCIAESYASVTGTGLYRNSGSGTCAWAQITGSGGSPGGSLGDIQTNGGVSTFAALTVGNYLTTGGGALNLDTTKAPSLPILQSGSALSAVSTDGPTAYHAFLSPTLTAYTNNMQVNWMPSVTACGASPTLNIDGLGDIPIRKADGTATTPGDCDTVGKILALHYSGTIAGGPYFLIVGGGGGVPVIVSTSGPVSDPGGTAAFLLNNAAGALTFNLPAGVPGYQRCYRNSTGKSGAITIAVTTSNTIDKAGVNGTTSTGTLVSGGALGDAACLVSDASNHWNAYISSGTWTNN